MKPLITDIQRFSIHDGPGIRTVIFFKGCNLQCSWCQNPETVSFQSEIAFYSKKCEELSSCLEVCPDGAIIEKGEFRIDRNKCTKCGLCVDECATGALKLVGSEYSLNKLMDLIIKDSDYYKDSGGGVTLSGGEATLHADFILKLLKKCKHHQIHTNIETNGYFSWNKFEPLLPFLDLIYFDIKIVDDEMHKKHTSRGNGKILDNLKKLIDHKAPVEFRMPLIPGQTTTKENLDDVRELLKENKIEQLHLLPYHSLGESKLVPISSSRKPQELNPLTKNELEEIIELFEKEEIDTILYR